MSRGRAFSRASGRRRVRGRRLDDGGRWGCVRARSSPRVCLARVLARGAMEDDGDGDDASLRARSRRGVRATVAKRRRMDDSIDPSSLGVDVASPSSSARAGWCVARAARTHRARDRGDARGVASVRSQRGRFVVVGGGGRGVARAAPRPRRARMRAKRSGTTWRMEDDGITARAFRTLSRRNG